jgi:hypothetical protein
VRESLKKSLADSPVSEFERYPKGSIVLCNACALPIFKLDYGISLGDKAGKAASAFKPLSVADLETLENRTDIDAGVRAVVKAMSPEQRARHINGLRDVRSGDPMICPCCAGTFVQVLSVEKSEALDNAYTIELLTIPPESAPPVRGKRLGYAGDWVH